MPDEDPVIETAKATQEIAKAIGKGIDVADKFGSFVGQFIKGPAEEAVGTIIDRIRFVRIEQRVRFIQKIEQLVAETGVQLSPNSVPLNLAVPLFSEATLEENEELQTRYAALLVNAANSDGSVEVRRLHVEILSQLGPIEIMILDALYAGLDIPGSGEGVLGAFLPGEVKTGKTLDTSSLNPFPRPPEEIQVPLQNLIRLGCVVSTTAMPAANQITNWVAITALGRNFVRACKVD